MKRLAKVLNKNFNTIYLDGTFFGGDDFARFMSNFAEKHGELEIVDSGSYTEHGMRMNFRKMRYKVKTSIKYRTVKDKRFGGMYVREGVVATVNGVDYVVHANGFTADFGRYILPPDSCVKIIHTY